MFYQNQKKLSIKEFDGKIWDTELGKLFFLASPRHLGRSAAQTEYRSQDVLPGYSTQAIVLIRVGVLHKLNTVLKMFYLDTPPKP